MNRRLLHTVLRRAGLPADATPDADLARRFAEARDEAAFTVLIHRHGPLVWAVCRQMLPDPADADDAFQAVFLALLQSAGRLKTVTSVGGWLHGAAVRVCLKARRSAVRRKQRERAAAKPEGQAAEPTRSDPDWADLHAAVHEEVERLPEALRTAFVLCDLQWVRQPEAAERLGWKLGTLSGRLTRARQMLLKKLTARGLAPVLAVGSVAVGGTAVGGGVPPVLAESVFALARSGPDGVSSTVLELARGATEGMMGKVKLFVGGVMLTTGLMVTTGTGWLPTADAQRPNPEPKPATAPTGADVGTANTDPTAAPASAAPKKAGITAAGRQRFEHLVVNRPATAEILRNLFQEREKEGWEYVGTIGLANPADIQLVFKRPKPGAAAATTTLAANLYRSDAGGYDSNVPYPSVNNPRSDVGELPAAGPYTQPRYPAPAAPTGALPNRTQDAAPKSTTMPAVDEPKKPGSAEASVIRLKHLSTEQASKLILPILGNSHKQLGGSADTVAVPDSGVIVLYGVSKENVAKIMELLGEVDVPATKKPDAEPVIRSDV